MSEGTSANRITVSEDTLRRILAEFKLELFTELQKYATTAVVHALETRLGIVEREGSFGTREEMKDHEERLRSVENMRSQMRGIIVALAFVVTTLATMSWHIWG